MERQKFFTPEMSPTFGKNFRHHITLVSEKALRGGVNTVSTTKNEEVKVLRLTEMSRTSG
jgi:hypothetical protein